MTFNDDKSALLGVKNVPFYFCKLITVKGQYYPRYLNFSSTWNLLHAIVMTVVPHCLVLDCVNISIYFSLPETPYICHWYGLFTKNCIRQPLMLSCLSVRPSLFICLSVHPSICLSAWIGATPTWPIFVKVYILGFLPKFVNTVQYWLKVDKSKSSFMLRPTYIMIFCLTGLHNWDSVLCEVCTEA